MVEKLKLNMFPVYSRKVLDRFAGQNLVPALALVGFVCRFKSDKDSSLKV